MTRHKLFKLAVAVLVGMALTLPDVPATLAARLANDDFSRAKEIRRLPFSDSVDNTQATTEFGEPQNCEFSPRTVWYSITPAANAVLRADMAGSSFSDTILTVYRQDGSGFGGLSALSCASFGGAVTFRVEAGRTYFLQAGDVGFSFPDGGSLQVNVQEIPSPANDDFANATPIDTLPSSKSADNGGGTTESGEPQNCNFSLRTVWYSITPTANAALRADMAGSSFSDTILTVYRQDGSGFGGLSFLGCASFGDAVTFRVEQGATYYLQAGDIFTGGGNLQVNVEAVPPPPNDDFANATSITEIDPPFSDAVNTGGASREAGEPTSSCAQFNNPGGSVWYAFTTNESKSVSAFVDNTFFSTDVAVYTGNSLNNLTEVGCRSFGGRLTFRAEANTTYYFQVAGLGGQGGPLRFNLEVAPPPVASFFLSHFDPSVFDTVQFFDYPSFDPGEVGLQSRAWNFGDGTTLTTPDCCPTHRYTADGDYMVQLTVTTFDGRAASISQTVQVRTHDVAIVKLTAPRTASAGQTRILSVDLRNTRYEERVEVQFFKSVPGGFEFIGFSRQTVPVQPASRTTQVTFSYTFTSADATIGKVTFKAGAFLLDARDALPADNEAISSPPTKVSR
ncbi:MAG TPA: PKD domain-containing protein [Anaerolineae bacterium]|nr:PKD domain-containing protein [Anaerolineae bacterium]